MTYGPPPGDATPSAVRWGAGHRPVAVRCFAWPYCVRCGLVGLRNAATARAARAACTATDEVDRV